MLLHGDENLSQRPLLERREIMRREFAEEQDVVAFASAVDVEVDIDVALAGASADAERCSSVAVLDKELRNAVDGGCEGLMVKRLDSTYEPSTKRSDCWLKVKKDYLEGMGDSLDLVPIGGWRGQGRKSRWISPWLLATFDPETGTLGSVCRVMSGFTDEFYIENTKRYLGAELRAAGKASAVGSDDVDAAGADANADADADDDAAVASDADCDDDDGADAVDSGDEEGLLDFSGASRAGGSASRGLLRASPAPGVDTGERAQFWFEPTEVWEIRGADITISPKHMAAKGLVDPQRGLSLRFPRFLRKRPDKTVQTATSPEQLAELFRKQTQQRK
eukprot:TRINITY_DN25162_c0_g1_i1.p1 TRINITY_DN25162_c0_g1~~TRINITY_DN25162_c0_g1_i1.p1  ORF type:complete len:335 (-),score=96.66 TRINITY_DN25162_c0_g1_i1:275-1279(-)